MRRGRSMFTQRIGMYLKLIKNLFSSRLEILFYVLMGLGVVFLVRAATHSHSQPDAYVCLSGLISLTCLMTAFVVAIQTPEDNA